jgi:acyl dehydratase
MNVTVGTVLPAKEFTVTRADLIRYAGASGDRNPVHWSDRHAAAVALPGVIAHGMLTMGRVAQIVTEWTGDPTAVVDYRVRFSRPVVVPDDDAGATLRVSATVAEVIDDRHVRVEIVATVDGADILTGATAVVRLPR